MIGTATATVPVVGVTFVSTYPANLHRLAEVADDLTRGEPLSVVLLRNPGNPHDSNAIEVHVPALGDLAMIGHVPREIAARLAPKLDAGVTYDTWVAGVRIDPAHLDRPGIDIGVKRAQVPEF